MLWRTDTNTIEIDAVGQRDTGTSRLSESGFQNLANLKNGRPFQFPGSHGMCTMTPILDSLEPFMRRTGQAQHSRIPQVPGVGNSRRFRDVTALSPITGERGDAASE
jgi:hypothetical protein